jgi:hypothetical protein
MKRISCYLFPVLLLLAATDLFAGSGTWTYDPATTTANIAENRVWFTTTDSTATIVGPQIYIDDTDKETFLLIKNAVTIAKNSGTKLVLKYADFSCPVHGNFEGITEFSTLGPK